MLLKKTFCQYFKIILMMSAKITKKQTLCFAFWLSIYFSIRWYAFISYNAGIWDSVHGGKYKATSFNNSNYNFCFLGKKVIKMCFNRSWNFKHGWFDNDWFSFWCECCNNFKQIRKESEVYFKIPLIIILLL